MQAPHDHFARALQVLQLYRSPHYYIVGLPSALVHIHIYSDNFNHADPSHSSTLTTPSDQDFALSSPSVYFKPLPPLSPSQTFKEIASKPLPTPPVKDSDLLDMVTLLQTVNRSMKALNASISSLTEDMASIETMLITRELLIQDLSGQPEAVDALEDPLFVDSPKTYLRNLYQKFAHTSLSYTQ
jgi:hypothetical protein